MFMNSVIAKKKRRKRQSKTTRTKRIIIETVNLTTLVLQPFYLHIHKITD